MTILSTNFRRFIWIALIAIVLIRLFTLGVYPLQDTTEARYADIARIMLETQDWITPQFNYGVPFWGKPPLATWLSAASFKIFGISEFAARLPSLVLSIFMLALVYQFTRWQRSTGIALLSIYILASSAMFFIAAGAVIMDTALVAGCTLSMLAFWKALHGSRRIWGYLFFIGISLGLLAKGPLILVLISVPLGFWVLYQGNIRKVWQNIPWISGGLLMLLLTLPWYIMAEIKTPGFLDYFLLGEHWRRFTETGWHGDLYGTAHAKARGTIWLYSIAAFLPWSLILPFMLWRKASRVKTVITNNLSWISYLLAWALTPIVFFSFAGNILATYALPAMIPLSILAAEVLLCSDENSLKNADQGHNIHLDTRNENKPLIKEIKSLIGIGFLIPISLLLIILLESTGYIEYKSQDKLLEKVNQLNKDSQLAHQGQLIYMQNRPFSARYYSQGKALEVKTWQQATAYIEDKSQDYYAVRNNRLLDIPKNIISKLQLIDEFYSYTLFKDTVKVKNYP